MEEDFPGTQAVNSQSKTQCSQENLIQRPQHQKMSRESQDDSFALTVNERRSSQRIKKKKKQGTGNFSPLKNVTEKIEFFREKFTTTGRIRNIDQEEAMAVKIQLRTYIDFLEDEEVSEHYSEIGGSPKSINMLIMKAYEVLKDIETHTTRSFSDTMKIDEVNEEPELKRPVDDDHHTHKLTTVTPMKPTHAVRSKKSIMTNKRLCLSAMDDDNVLPRDQTPQDDLQDRNVASDKPTYCNDSLSMKKPAKRFKKSAVATTKNTDSFDSKAISHQPKSTKKENEENKRDDNTKIPRLLRLEDFSCAEAAAEESSSVKVGSNKKKPKNLVKSNKGQGTKNKVPGEKFDGVREMKENKETCNSTVPKRRKKLSKSLNSTSLSDDMFKEQTPFETTVDTTQASYIKCNPGRPPSVYYYLSQSLTHSTEQENQSLPIPHTQPSSQQICDQSYDLTNCGRSLEPERICSKDPTNSSDIIPPTDTNSESFGWKNDSTCLSSTVNPVPSNNNVDFHKESHEVKDSTCTKVKPSLVKGLNQFPINKTRTNTRLQSRNGSKVDPSDSVTLSENTAGDEKLESDLLPRKQSVTYNENVDSTSFPDAQYLDQESILHTLNEAFNFGTSISDDIISSNFSQHPTNQPQLAFSSIPESVQATTDTEPADHSESYPSVGIQSGHQSLVNVIAESRRQSQKEKWKILESLPPVKATPSRENQKRRPARQTKNAPKRKKKSVDPRREQLPLGDQLSQRVKTQLKTPLIANSQLGNLSMNDPSDKAVKGLEIHSKNESANNVTAVEIIDETKLSDTSSHGYQVADVSLSAFKNHQLACATSDSHSSDKTTNALSQSFCPIKPIPIRASALQPSDSSHKQMVNESSDDTVANGELYPSVGFRFYNSSQRVPSMKFQQNEIINHIQRAEMQNQQAPSTSSDFQQYCNSRVVERNHKSSLSHQGLQPQIVSNPMLNKVPASQPYSGTSMPMNTPGTFGMNLMPPTDNQERVSGRRSTEKFIPGNQLVQDSQVEVDPLQSHNNSRLQKLTDYLEISQVPESPHQYWSGSKSMEVTTAHRDNIASNNTHSFYKLSCVQNEKYPLQTLPSYNEERLPTKPVREHYPLDNISTIQSKLMNSSLSRQQLSFCQTPASDSQVCNGTCTIDNQPNKSANVSLLDHHPNVVEKNTCSGIDKVESHASQVNSQVMQTNQTVNDQKHYPPINASLKHTPNGDCYNPLHIYDSSGTEKERQQLRDPPHHHQNFHLNPAKSNQYVPNDRPRHQWNIPMTPINVEIQPFTMNTGSIVQNLGMSMPFQVPSTAGQLRGTLVMENMQCLKNDGWMELREAVRSSHTGFGSQVEKNDNKSQSTPIQQPQYCSQFVCRDTGTNYALLANQQNPAGQRDISGSDSAFKKLSFPSNESMHNVRTMAAPGISEYQPIMPQESCRTSDSAKEPLSTKSAKSGPKEPLLPEGNPKKLRGSKKPRKSRSKKQMGEQSQLSQEQLYLQNLAEQENCLAGLAARINSQINERHLVKVSGGDAAQVSEDELSMRSSHPVANNMKGNLPIIKEAGEPVNSNMKQQWTVPNARKPSKVIRIPHRSIDAVTDTGSMLQSKHDWLKSFRSNRAIPAGTDDQSKPSAPTNLQQQSCSTATHCTPTISQGEQQHVVEMYRPQVSKMSKFQPRCSLSNQVIRDRIELTRNKPGSDIITDDLFSTTELPKPPDTSAQPQCESANSANVYSQDRVSKTRLDTWMSHNWLQTITHESLQVDLQEEIHVSQPPMLGDQATIVAEEENHLATTLCQIGSQSSKNRNLLPDHGPEVEESEGRQINGSEYEYWKARLAKAQENPYSHAWEEYVFPASPYNIKPALNWILRKASQTLEKPASNSRDTQSNLFPQT